MVAMILLVGITLLVSSVGSLVLIRRSSARTAEEQLYSEAKVVAQYPVEFLTRGNLVEGAVRRIGQYRSLSALGLAPDGTFSGSLPAALQGTPLDTAALRSGHSVAGTLDGLVYVLIPLDQLTPAEQSRLPQAVPAGDLPVLVATRTSHPPVTGLQWFLVVGLVSMAAAAVVAYLLANRFARPLETAADATKRIAAGNLQTRMPVSPHDMPEFAALALAINTMSDELARARDQQRQFLLSVSHDLRTPLTSIRGYAEAVAEGATDDVAGAAGIIGAEAARLQRLVQDLLDLARLDAKRFSFRTAAVDVSDAVERAMDHLRPEATRLGVELTSSCPPGGTVWALTDGDRLLQILSNLLENALKFARAHVEIGGRADAGQALLWVDDDGVGIAPADLPRVFEPHFTSDVAGPRRAGTGLGLAIVSELAAAMGGGVRAESPISASGGTRIVLWLPAATGVPAASPPAPVTAR